MSESGLRAICLIISIGLHVGLGALGWQGFGATETDSGPIMVALADHPAAEQAAAAATNPSASLRGQVKSAAKETPPRRGSTPVIASVASLQANEPPTAAAICAIPAATVVEPVTAVPAQVVPAPGGEPGGAVAADGEGTGSGLALVSAPGHSGGAGEGHASGGVVLATPRYASNPKPEYPRLARQNRWEGTVHLRATISDRGEVEAVVVENSSGHQVLDASALGGVRRWSFVPARRGGIQVPCEVRIPVAFKLER
mgnify:CR=1 FL=1